MTLKQPRMTLKLWNADPPNRTPIERTLGFSLGKTTQQIALGRPLFPALHDDVDVAIEDVE